MVNKCLATDSACRLISFFLIFFIIVFCFFFLFTCCIYRKSKLFKLFKSIVKPVNQSRHVYENTILPADALFGYEMGQIIVMGLA